jgi:hypothetical protein
MIHAVSRRAGDLWSFPVSTTNPSGARSIPSLGFGKACRSLVLHGKDCPRLDRGLEGPGNGWKTSSRSNSEGVTGLCDFSCAHDALRRATLRLFLRLDSIPFSADTGGGCLHENGTKRNCAIEGEIPDSILKRPMIPALERSRRERTRPPAPPSTPSTLGEFPTPALVEICNAA